uniref:Cyclin-dependent kinases regulatory subunit n=1 Tax=Astatotilapia calliptera TaxID=8154 RepID=A0AAX7SEG1_ASTCA
MSHKQIYYSDKYDDDKYEYRHVMLPKELAKRVPKTHLMSETEWRNLGVQQSQGWVHYMIHQPGNNSQRHDFKYWFGNLCLLVGVWWCSLLIILN